MKRFVQYLAIGLLLAGVGISEAADVIDLNALTVSSSRGGEYSKLNIVNGSGLSVNGEHDNDYRNMWLSAQFDNPTITFDLGKLYNVAQVKVWQYNYAYLGTENRGVQNFNIFKSNNGKTFELVTPATLVKSTGGSIPSQIIELNCEARYIRFVVISNYGDESTGLSEVQFTGTPVSEYDVPDIFGFEAGNSFAYQGIYQGSVKSLERTINVTDVTQASYQEISSVMGNPVSTEFYETWPSLKLRGFIDSGIEYLFSEGLDIIWDPMQVSETKLSSAIVSGVNISVKAEVLAEETVSTSVGSFKAKKVLYTARIWGNGEDEQATFYHWIAPYLGMVKYQDHESNYTLSNFSILNSEITPEKDTDSDGLKDIQELINHNTSRFHVDTDGDGLSDYVEVQSYFTDPTLADTDGDGLSDSDEVNSFNTSPLDPDTDNDDLTDFVELNEIGTNPLVADTDGDTLNDGEEINLGTNPLNEDSDEDNMPDEWEVRFGLDPLSDDSAEDFDGDLVTNLDEYINGRHPANKEPLKPVLNFPDNGAAGVSLPLTLYSNPFVDEDADTHFATRWQISLNNAEFFEDELVFDIVSAKELLSLNIPALILEPNTFYYWRTKYTDSRNATSEWSEIRTFESGADGFLDLDNNGVPDSQQINSETLDLDQNGVPDKNQTDIRCIQTKTGNNEIGVKNGLNVLNIEKLNWVDPNDIVDDINRPDEFLIGLLNFKIETSSVGAQVEITVHLSKPAPANARWFKYSETAGWQDFSSAATFSPDRRTITLALRDGGSGDLDGVANGFIVDPSGLGTGDSSTPTVPTAAGGGGGGGGCFIATAAFGSKLERHVAVLRAFRDQVMLQNKAGRLFTTFYYTYSPPIAEWVKKYESVKTAVQLCLLPVVGFSWMYLHYHTAVDAIMVLFSLLVLLKIASKVRKRSIVQLSPH